MDDEKYKEYLQQFLYCRKMAEWSTTSKELKINWLRLADRWLAMVPGGTQLNSTVGADIPAGEQSKVPNSTTAGVLASSA